MPPGLHRTLPAATPKTRRFTYRPGPNELLGCIPSHCLKWGRTILSPFNIEAGPTVGRVLPFFLSFDIDRSVQHNPSLFCYTSRCKLRSRPGDRRRSSRNFKFHM